jgi:hypothetical protein
MQTEQLQLRERPRDGDSVSPALQDSGPPPWRLTDLKGRPVALSSAGCVLYFGRTYQLRVASFLEPGLPPEFCLVSRPSFVVPQQGSQTVTKHGEEYRCLSFQVRRESGWLQFFKWPYEVRCGDLAIEYSSAENANPRQFEFTCPVVVRTPWTVGIILLLAVGALLGWLISHTETVVRDLIAQGTWPPNLADGWWPGIPSSPRFWLWPLTLAIANPILALLSNVSHLWQRSRQLEERFRDRWTARAR